jgi:hypothetical protein
LLDDIFSRSVTLLVHSIHDDLEFSIVEGLEEEGLLEALCDLFDCFWGLHNDSCDKVALFIPSAKGLSTH